MTRQGLSQRRRGNGGSCKIHPIDSQHDVLLAKRRRDILHRQTRQLARQQHPQKYVGSIEITWIDNHWAMKAFFTSCSGRYRTHVTRCHATFSPAPAVALFHRINQQLSSTCSSGNGLSQNGYDHEPNKKSPVITWSVANVLAVSLSPR